MAKDKTGEKTLSEVIYDRTTFYQGKIMEAFDRVYKSADIAYIEKFENAVSELVSKVSPTGKGNLERRAETAPIIPVQHKPRPVEEKPRLTSYQYRKARDAGMTNEEIKTKFRMDSSYQICGFARQYLREKAERKKSKKKR